MSETRPASRILSEQESHHILARAVELDSHDGSYLTLSDLRAAAIEAGIQAEAFDRASGEYTQNHRFTAAVPSIVASRWAPVVANLKAAFAFWVALTVLTRVVHLLPEDWTVYAIRDMLACGIGIWFAARVRGAVVRIGLTGLAAALVALFAVHAAYGIESAQGGPTQFAVLITGVLAAGAVAVGGRFSPVRRRGLTPPVSESLERNVATAATRQQSAEADRHEPLRLVRVGSA